jgi:catalase
VLEDHHLIEKLEHFDRGRIPERVVQRCAWFQTEIGAAR